MAVFKVETKNNIDIGKKPRVYFTCHPDDFEKHFKKVCKDIFKTHDCAIYYTEDMTEVIAEDEKQVDLGRNNLVVVPVTFKLLTAPNRAMDEDIPYALKEYIPVLPIMMESGIDEIYSKPDKFGELQYLNPYSTDLTEIPYEEKLKKYLESVLISDELAKRVRAAFDAYIFLSYRKKDRRYANELMRLMHGIPECRAIAIWFDEFLTPGESFRESIDRILHDSKLFALLVTPNLLEEPEGKPNFVMAEEYPAAKVSGIPILPAEMAVTDKNTLSEKFPGIPECVTPSDEAFLTRLLDTVTKLSTEANSTPEYNYLIGLAYLDGIDVEVDYEKATRLIIEAANRSCAEAVKKLVLMYQSGEGVQKDSAKAIVWQEKLVEMLRLDSDDELLLQAMFELSDLYIEAEQRDKLHTLLEDIDSVVWDLEHSDNAKTAALYRYDLHCRRGKESMIEGSTNTAAHRYEKALYIISDIAKEDPTELNLRRLAICYQTLGELSHPCDDDRVNGIYLETCRGIGWFKKALDTMEKTSDTIEQRRLLADMYEKYGMKYLEIYPDCPEFAESKIKKGISICRSLMEYEESPEDRRRMARLLCGLGDCWRSRYAGMAKEYYEESLKIVESLLSETAGLEEKRLLSLCCFRLGSVLAEQSRNEEATVYYERGLNYYEKNAEATGMCLDLRLLAQGYGEMAEYRYAAGDIEGAYKWRLMVVPLWEKVALNVGYFSELINAELMEAYYKLSVIADEMGNGDMRSFYFEKYIEIKLGKSFCEAVKRSFEIVQPEVYIPPFSNQAPAEQQFPVESGEDSKRNPFSKILEKLFKKRKK